MKTEEFRNLKQGALTVTQYIRKFMKLSRCASDDIDTDKKKQVRFRRGLSLALRTQLVTHIYPDFNTLMNKAILLENARSELENDRKRKFITQRQKQLESNQNPSSATTLRCQGSSLPCSSRHRGPNPCSQPRLSEVRAR